MMMRFLNTAEKFTIACTVRTVLAVLYTCKGIFYKASKALLIADGQNV